MQGKMNEKRIVDTNVPAKAATNTWECKEEELEMQMACIEFIQKLLSDKYKLVLDMERGILGEYEREVSHDSDMGRVFWKWLYNYVSRMDIENDMVLLEREKDGSYIAFPLDAQTEGFDPNDRIFIALSRTHREHPIIVEAADGKWLGFQKAFEKYGIHIEFLDVAYASMMYERKIHGKHK